MTSTAVASLESWLTKVQAIAPLIERHREDCERERRLVPDVFEALRDSGLLRLTSPGRLGGEEAGLKTATRVIEELSRLDGAVGWNVMISAHACFFADYLRDEAAPTIYSPAASFAANLTPSGQAVVVPGGFRLTGRWPFASGCDNAQWMAGTSTVLEDDRPRLGTNGQPQRLIAFVPMADCRTLDTWHTTGLRGTGSQDVEVNEVFVPEERTFLHAMLAMGPSRAAPAYRQAFFQLASPTVAAVALGIAREAIEAFKELASGKTPARSTMRLADQHTVQQRVGKAEALLRSARAYVYQVVDELVSRPQDEDWPHDEATASAVLAGSHATQCAVEAVDLMFDAAGGTSIYATSRLERCFRDVHTVNHHLIVSPTNIEMAGQHFLGLGFQIRR